MTCSDEEDSFYIGQESRRTQPRCMNYPADYPEDLKDSYIQGYLEGPEIQYEESQYDRHRRMGV